MRQTNSVSADDGNLRKVDLKLLTFRQITNPHFDAAQQRFFKEAVLLKSSQMRSE